MKNPAKKRKLSIKAALSCICMYVCMHVCISVCVPDGSAGLCVAGLVPGLMDEWVECAAGPCGYELALMGRKSQSTQKNTPICSWTSKEHTNLLLNLKSPLPHTKLLHSTESIFTDVEGGWHSQEQAHNMHFSFRTTKERGGRERGKEREGRRVVKISLWHL